MSPLVKPIASESGALVQFPEKLRQSDSHFIQHASDAVEMIALARQYANQTLLVEGQRHIKMIAYEAKQACGGYQQALPPKDNPEGVEFLCRSGEVDTWLSTPHCLNCVLFDFNNHPQFKLVAEGAD
jgi:hypothetical protein